VRTDERVRLVAAPVGRLWSVVAGIGGLHGWYGTDLGWRLRGLADVVVGGPGFRAGRRDPDTVVVGDQVDFWRVETVEPESLLRLRAEMRLPGLTLLELRVAAAPSGADGSARSLYTQRVEFHPDGVLGRLYWASAAPLHGPVFGTMANGIARAAERC
jgi:uncharacterized protein YndB with AHSA1/START domain